MDKQKYIGVTIGPIYRTLYMARKTRELWGASYLFSYIMRNLAERLLEFVTPESDLIMPARIDNQSYNYGAGLTPDRLILKSKEEYWENLEDAINKTVSHLSSEISKQLKNITYDQMECYLRHYLQIHCVEIELDTGANPVLGISPFLDVQDLHERFVQKDDKGYLGVFLNPFKKYEGYPGESHIKVNRSFLFKDAFAKADSPKTRFKSLPEIATWSLRELNEIEYDKLVKQYIERDSKKAESEIEAGFLSAVKQEFSKDFKTCHKYVAIVSADGDDIGKLLKKIGDDPVKLGAFSRNMNEFSREASKIIDESDGLPVYAGGDDLLFFAPADGIFTLLEELESKFKKNVPECSLSFGVAITYYKFPLEEALQKSRELLKTAKNPKCIATGGKKNAISYSILKHSGRSFGATLYKHNDNKFYSLLMANLEGKKDDMPLLTSIIYSVEKYDPIFREIGPNLDAITNFMNNSFDEEIHEEYKETIDKVCQLVVDQLEIQKLEEEKRKAEKSKGEKKDEKEDEKKPENTVHALLRTLHFLKRTDNEE